MSRIISGRFKGRRLEVPKGRSVRPTTDRMRERVFSMLAHGRYPDLVGARIADLFAGTGALGLEALSRGATHVTFVEKSPSSTACLTNNITSLGAKEETNILQTSACRLPAASSTYNVVFMDPPYHEGLVEPALTSLIDAGWIADNCVIICELASDETLSLPASLELVDERSQSAQRVVFLTKA